MIILSACMQPECMHECTHPCMHPRMHACMHACMQTCKGTTYRGGLGEALWIQNLQGAAAPRSKKSKLFCLGWNFQPSQKHRETGSFKRAPESQDLSKSILIIFSFSTTGEISQIGGPLFLSREGGSRKKKPAHPPLRTISGTGLIKNTLKSWFLEEWEIWSFM